MKMWSNPMLYYIFRRILMMIPTLVITSALIFAIIEAPPGDYLESYIAELKAQGEAVDSARIEYLRKEYFRIERRGCRDRCKSLSQRRQRIGGTRHSSEASSSAWCSRASVSITSSRSPSTTESSRYSVRSMR